jgi:hypothetical protein
MEASEQKRASRACLCCGKPGQVVMEHTLDRSERGVFCEGCAVLLRSEVVQDAHGTYIRAWVAP